ATGVSCRDQDYRRALQSLVSGQLPRADGDDLGLCQRLDAVLPDGRAAARRVDEPASRRAPAAWRCVIGKQEGRGLSGKQQAWPDERSNIRLSVVPIPA